MPDQPRISANWKKEIDARRFAQGLLALVGQLNQQSSSTRPGAAADEVANALRPAGSRPVLPNPDDTQERP